MNTEQSAVLCTLDELIRNQGEHGITFNRHIAPDNNLSDADLSDADLSDADLSDANLSGADLSGATGLLSASEFIDKNFEFDAVGNLIVYKVFGLDYQARSDWVIEAGSIIQETCNPCRVSDCASGINVAKRDWSGFGNQTVWKCVIKPQWIAGVVVPYHTDGKIRCEKIQLVEPIN